MPKVFSLHGWCPYCSYPVSQYEGTLIERSNGLRIQMTRCDHCHALYPMFYREQIETGLRGRLVQAQRVLTDIQRRQQVQGRADTEAGRDVARFLAAIDRTLSKPLGCASPTRMPN